MQKKYFFIVLILSTIIAISIFAPTLANTNDEDHHREYPKATPIPGAEYVYAQAATVVLNLPQGGICNKTNITFNVMDVSPKSTKGAEDFLQIGLWIPSANKFTAVAAIDDNQWAIDSLKAMLAGVTYFQCIKVDDQTIDVWKEDGSLVLNLTKPVNIMFGDPLPANSIYRTLNFTLPPMTIRFIQTGEVYEKLTATNTYPSGWSRDLTEWHSPGWATVQIPAWTGTTWMPNAAIYAEKMNIIAIKP
jgi:hypothetical protein